MTPVTLVYGNVIHSKNIGQVEYLNNTAVVVGHHGKILCVQEDANVQQLADEYGIAGDNILLLEETQFLMPGMIDTHIHASQYVNAGLALDLPLLDWLNKYTFPTEERFSDLKFAEEIYSRVVANTLINGTTTAMYFATLHKEASLLLADLADRMGQRAFIGKVSMDQNSPSYYTEETEAALTEAEDFIVSLLSKKYAAVQPVITPRFAITCSMRLMKGLALLADKYDVNIQTHVSENPAECSFAVQLFPGCDHYTSIYAQAGLLTDKTILAHAVYLNSEEVQVVKESGTSISHCPNSNCSIRSGLCDARSLLDSGLHVGLGTDISGGYNPSLLDAMRFSITVSNICAMKNSENYKPLTYREAFFMATMGGAQALGIGENVGTIEEGKDFDALVVDLAQPDGNIDLWSGETMDLRLSKWVHLGDDRSIKKVFVRGIEVKQQAKEMLASKRLHK